MSFASKWKSNAAQRTAIAVAVKAAFKQRDAARLALLPQFAKAYNCKIVRNDDGEAVGFPKASKNGAAAKKSLQRLLTLAFQKKGAKSKATSPLELLVTYITKTKLGKNAVLRAVKAAFTA